MSTVYCLAIFGAYHVRRYCNISGNHTPTKLNVTYHHSLSPSGPLLIVILNKQNLLFRRYFTTREILGWIQFNSGDFWDKVSCFIKEPDGVSALVREKYPQIEIECSVLTTES